MKALAADRTIAGVDGCKGGWIAVTLAPGGEPQVGVFRRFAELLNHLPADALVAVDMPVGLPEWTGPGGRGPERLVRQLLGARRSSVFSIPSRSAVHAEAGPFTSVEDWHAAHRRASAVALATSNPPRKISIQAFGIFGKIREIDDILRRSGPFRARLIESHPEVAFWRLAGERAMLTSKKAKGRVNPEGIAERKALLAAIGLPAALLQAVPRGAAADDLLDAAAMLFVAARHARGEAEPFPDPPGRDSYGLPIAIWA